MAAPSAAGVGSDQHLANKAEELARASAVAGSDQHLSNVAAELANEQRAYQAATDRLTAQAEQYQRSTSAAASNRAAQMAQAESYETSRCEPRAARETGPLRWPRPSRTCSSSRIGPRDGNGYGDEFVPGSRHMPVR